jgi:hypothetical protein
MKKAIFALVVLAFCTQVGATPGIVQVQGSQINPLCTITAASFVGPLTGAVTGSGANLTSIPNSATTATAANTASAIVARDANGAFAASKVTVSTYAVTALVDPAQQACTTGQYQFGAGGLYLCVASRWVKAMAGATQITWTAY